MSPRDNNFAKILNGFIELLSKIFARHVISTPTRVVVEPKPIPQTTQPEVTPPESQPMVPTQLTSSGFLVCPVKRNDAKGNPLTSKTVEIISVIDHSGTKIDPSSSNTWGITAKDKKVMAFNGELGDGESTLGAPYGYLKTPPGPFFLKREINYVGSGSGLSGYPDNYYLNYDGHAGYDFRCKLMTEIQAPADGDLYKAQTDPIDGVNKTWATKNLGKSDPTAWDGWHTFFIKHSNGYSTWFLHCIKLVDEIENQLTDYQKYVPVNKGQLIAYTGNHGGVPPHLHFEVRNDKGAVVDPYKDNLWGDS